MFNKEKLRELIKKYPSVNQFLRELYKKTDMKTSRATLYFWLNGRQPKANSVKALADFCGETMDFFYN